MATYKFKDAEKPADLTVEQSRLKQIDQLISGSTNPGNTQRLEAAREDVASRLPIEELLEYNRLFPQYARGGATVTNIADAKEPGPIAPANSDNQAANTAA